MRKLSRLIKAASVVPVVVLALGAPAHAGEPATATVRVEGFGGVTLVPQATVTTTTVPVPIEGGTCSGTSVVGALYDAVNGNMKAKASGSEAEVLGIAGVNLPPFGGENYAFWSIWVNDRFAGGTCSEQVSTGDRVVFAAQCFTTGPLCPTDPAAPEHFLTATLTGATVIAVNEPVSLTVGSISTETGMAEPNLPAGTVVGDGSRAVQPGADGKASLSFGAPGTYTLQARAPGSVPSDPYTVCVHNGDDGTCGTSAPGSLGVAGIRQTAPYTGPFALVARQSAPLDNHSYPRNAAPRLLTGTVAGHSAVQSVRLELHRRFHGRCSAFDGARARFVGARCGSGPFFQVSTNASWSYLLPAPLPRGRYVLDVQGSDAAGNSITPARGSSRIVFYVD